VGNGRLRLVDLAREHGLSAQAVRNYEEEGILPTAARTRLPVALKRHPPTLAPLTTDPATEAPAMCRGIHGEVSR
jgi:hypothetical protein